MNLEWIKKHKYAAAAGAVAALLIFFLILRRSSGGGGSLGSAIAAQNQGQLQMAQLNAQLGAQSEQTQAQLAAEEFSAQTQQQEQQNQLVGNLAGTLLPIQFESQLYQQELTAQMHQQDTLLPLEQEALNISKQGNRAQTGQNELALLLSEISGGPGGFAAGLPVQGASTKPSGFNLTTPFGGLGLNLGTGLFG